MVSKKILKIVSAVAVVTAVTICIGVGLSRKKDANLRLASSASQAQWNDGDLFVNGAPAGEANKVSGRSPSGKANKSPSGKSSKESSPPPSGKANKGSGPPSNTPQPTRRTSAQPTRRNTLQPTQINSLVNSPRCIPGFRCFQNGDFGINDGTRFNIDLVLEVANESHANAFARARAKWMQVITGDLSSRPSSQFPRPDRTNYLCSNDPPSVIDDLVICGRDASIDGPGQVLGFASPLWTRRDPQTNKRTAIVGRMQFDIVDIDNLIAKGTWESVIVHEMGHVLGIGSLWRNNGLIGSNLLYSGQRAISVWRNDWGCVTATPPVETDFGPGTRGAHWDEDCLIRELMTGFIQDTPPNPLSKLTIASLEDIGYTVDYMAADVYDSRNTNPRSGCCRSPFSPDEGALAENSMPPLSSTGTSNAVAYGLDILMQSAIPGSLVEMNELEYVGDRVVVVLYQENGYIYDVHVTKE